VKRKVKLRQVYRIEFSGLIPLHLFPVHAVFDEPEFPKDAWSLFLFVFFVLVEVLFLRQVAVFVKILVVFLFFVFEFFVFLEIIGDGVQRYRMSLRHLQLGLALGTAEDLSLLHFVFVHINFCGTLWATEHGSILRFGVG
jgi:hypothetical protein